MLRLMKIASQTTIAKSQRPIGSFDEALAAPHPGRSAVMSMFAMTDPAVSLPVQTTTQPQTTASSSGDRIPLLHPAGLDRTPTLIAPNGTIKSHLALRRQPPQHPPLRRCTCPPHVTDAFVRSAASPRATHACCVLVALANMPRCSSPLYVRHRCSRTARLPVRRRAACLQ